MFFNQCTKRRARAAVAATNKKLQAIDVAPSGIVQCHKKEKLKQFAYLLLAILY